MVATETEKSGSRGRPAQQAGWHRRIGSESWAALERAAAQDSDPIRRCASLRDAPRTASVAPWLRASAAETVPRSTSVSTTLNGRRRATLHQT